MSNLRALVIDDHPLFRKGLASVLRKIDVITAVDEADSAAAGYERWQTGRFGLVCLDLSLPDESGFTLLARAAAQDLVGSALVVSMYDQARISPSSTVRGRCRFPGQGCRHEDDGRGRETLPRRQ